MTKLQKTYYRNSYLFATLMTLVFMSLISSSALGQATKIDFEDIGTAPQVVSTQFGDRGVLFRSAFLDTDPAARSGTRVLRSGNPSNEFNQGPFVIEFTNGQRRVRLFAGGRFALNGTLRAFDQNNQLVAQDGPKSVDSSGFTTVFEVTASETIIRRVELEMPPAVFESIDDLEYEGEAVGPPPTEPPVVQITSPAADTELDLQTITFEGTVNGVSLFPTARLILKSGLPPDSLAPPTNVPLPLQGSGTTRTFSHSQILGLGPHVLTIEAQNIAGLKGSSSVQFTNLPQAIRTRHAAEGGIVTFGQLVYGSVSGTCRFAVYDKGAIFDREGATFVVKGDIFEKWFGLREQGAFVGKLGCPTEDEHDVSGNARAQTFDGGRIYGGLPTGTHFVPAVFVEAMEKLRDQKFNPEEATGVPIADPTDSSGAMQTWLFQRFQRPDHPFLLPSTLEIRGTPPVLFVERQGGDLSDLFGIERTPKLPTISERFECDDLLGPCTVNGPPPDKCCESEDTEDDPDCKSVDLEQCPSPIENAGDRFCNGTTYPWGPPEWAAIEGHYVQTPAMGFARRFKFASEDNPLTHACNNFTNVLKTFACDWNLSLNLLKPFHKMRAENTLLEIEWEWWWSTHFFAFPTRTEPSPGDLIFTSGRWIIDCGHDPFKSEIHPPSVLVSMRTIKHKGRDATQANIWVSSVYSGDPVELEIFPPPRPSPDAILHVEKPTDESAAFGLNVERFVPSLNDVGVRFTAPRREVSVTDAGEMQHEPGRGYEGVWHVFWAP